MKPRTSNLIAIFLLMAMIVASSAYWIMRFRKPMPVAGVSASPSTVSEASPGVTEALFGEHEAVLSSLGDVRITGVVIAANPNDSIAIVIESDHPGRAIRVGAEVAPGIHLSEVHRRYVVLSDGANNTRINLPEGATQEAAAPEVVRDASQAVSAAGGLRGEPPHRSGNPDTDNNLPADAPSP